MQKGTALEGILKDIRELNKDFTKIKFANEYLPLAQKLRGYKEIVNIKRLNLIIFGIESLCFSEKEDLLEKIISELQAKKLSFPSIRDYNFSDLTKAKEKEIKLFQ